ncbi:MAG: SDR family NAD(P)-dependent oxidoreductase, partial [Myxococcales bacterium]|nr:SDR family NAD(P)-dependent oxidoreductase [Myxococcales bacterium]
MFDEIAERYDFLNRVLSMGIDHGWRRKTVQALIDSEGTEPKRVLDLATGTADLALAVAKRFPEAKVTGSDPSRNMLAIGEKKVAEAGAQVAAGDVKEDALEALAKEAEGSSGKIHVKKLNVADEAEVGAFVDWAYEAMGGLNGLVNNAGILRD